MTTIIKLFFVTVFLPLTILTTAQEKEIDHSNLQHPYLFFSRDDLPEIRSRMTHEPFLTRWEVFLRNADGVVKTPARRYDAENRNPGRARKHLENAGKTSFAYIITGDEKYSRRAIEEAMAIIDGFLPEEDDEMVWYNPSSRGWNKGADLNTAEVCYGLAMVYDWCYDVLSEQEKEQIVQALLEKGIYHFLHSIEGDRPDFWVGNPVSNWAGVVNGGVGLGALAIYGESETARKAVKYAHQYTLEFLDHVFLEDGGGHEGIMYARYGELFSLYYMMAHQRLFGVEKELMESFTEKLAGYWDIYLQGPDLKYANFNNMAENTFEGLWGIEKKMQGGPNSDINALMEILVPGGDPLLLWAADNGAPRFYWNGASPWYFLWRRPDAKAVQPIEKPDLQNAVLFRGAGHAIFQSDKIWLAYNAGWISNKSHNNRDLGSFVLVTGEERMVNDPGYGDGHALNHSTIIVNNEDQILGKGAKFLSLGSGKSFHYLASDLTEAYNQETVQKIIRHMILMKDDYIIVMDEIEVKNSAAFEWRLQTRHPVEITRHNHTLIHGENNDLILVDGADSVQTKVISWEGKNGPMNAISKKTVDGNESSLLVTLLVPAGKDVALTGGYPAASFQQGELIVQLDRNNSDRLSFIKTSSHWELKRVNDEHDLNLSDGSERSVQPMRSDEPMDMNQLNLPAWFFPKSN
ncbi:MAG: heparinase II/III family protein [Mariniphaga sp.]|nr:heparinase II/III family protein [Mariniphaga sp.]